MTNRNAARVACTLWTITLLLFLFGAIFSRDDARDASTAIVIVTSAVFILSFATVGALLVSRRPDNPIGWLLSAAALCYAVGTFSDAYAYNDALSRHSLPGVALVGLLDEWIWAVGVGLAATFSLLLSPDGRYLTRRWRMVGWISGGGIAMFVVGSVIKPGRVGDLPLRNPLGIEGADALSGIFSGLGIALVIVCVVASVVSLGLRFRSSRIEQAAAAQVASLRGPARGHRHRGLDADRVTNGNRGHGHESCQRRVVDTGRRGSVAIGIAILKYRLYDIDVIINRTLVYGALWALYVRPTAWREVRSHQAHHC